MRATIASESHDHADADAEVVLVVVAAVADGGDDALSTGSGSLEAIHSPLQWVR